MYGKLLLNTFLQKTKVPSAKLPLSISASHESDKHKDSLPGIMKAEFAPKLISVNLLERGFSETHREEWILLLSAKLKHSDPFRTKLKVKSKPLNPNSRTSKGEKEMIKSTSIKGRGLTTKPVSLPFKWDELIKKGKKFPLT